MKKYFDLVFRSIAATLMIGIGCLIYVNQPNPYGAFFFSVGLLGVFFFDLNLFTGKVGYVRTKVQVKEIIVIFLANIFSAFMFFSIPQVNFNFGAKLEVPVLLIFVRSFLCGVLIYLCVKEYKRGRPWVSLIAVPAFILAAAEHCIADMIFLVLTRTFTFEAFMFIILVSVGNAIGSLTFSLLEKKENF